MLFYFLLFDPLKYYRTFKKMRKSLGNKRNEITESDRKEIVRLYSTYEHDENYIDFDNDDFGYRKITIERPCYDKNDKVVVEKGNPKPNSKLRDTETVPFKEDVHEYFKREVLPHVPDAWIDEKKTKIGYEIPFTRHFYKFTPLRESSVVLDEIKQLEEKIQKSLNELFKG